jgi:hypothetical protein
VSTEVRAVSDFVRLKWSPIENLETLVSELQVRAFHDWRSFFDPSLAGFSSTLSALRGKREEILAQDFSGVQLEVAIQMDQPAKIIQHLIGSALTLKDNTRLLDGKWSFERSSASVSKGARLRHPGLSHALPLAWSDQAAADRDSSLDSYDVEAEAALFEGTDLEAARTFPFHQAISYRHVLHNLEESGKKPADTLISSIYSHFLGVREYLNTAELVSSIEDMTDWQAPGLVLAGDFHASTPLLAVMLQLAPAEEAAHDLDATVASVIKARDEYASLHDEEKAHRREKVLAETREMMRAMTNPTDKEKAEEQAENQKIHDLLVRAFGSGSKTVSADSEHSL